METNQVKAFGSGEPLPDLIQKQRDAVKITIPEESNESKAERQIDKLPQPQGWRILVVPYSQPKKSAGGIHYTDKAVKEEELATVIGKVVALGPLAYADDTKFAGEPWCEQNDYVIFGRYAGSRVRLYGGAPDGSDDLNCRLMNDDDILAVVNDPSDYVGLS